MTILHMLAAVSKLLRADFEVIDMVSDGRSLVEAAFKLQPDIIVTDISMPKMNGIEAIRMIRQSLPGDQVYLPHHARCDGVSEGSSKRGRGGLCS